MPVMPTRHVVTVDEFDRMVDAGVFGHDERIELIEGEIVDMSPIGPPQVACVNRLTMLLVPLVMDRAIVQVQGPFRANDLSKPQPDVALLRQRDDFYAKAHPDGPQPLLAIEVADSSLRFARTVKRPMYAKGGVPETWIVDLEGSVVEVATEPSAQGYGRLATRRPGDTLVPTAFPDMTIAVNDVLGVRG